jgi:hypothetical protein
MRTHPIHLTNGRARILEVRNELFAFGEVLDVVVTGRPDILVVICSGRPRAGEWSRALRAAGYDIRTRRRARTASPLRPAIKHATPETGGEHVATRAA